MAIGVIKNESTLALVEEVTEGTYLAPSGATDYVEPLSEGMEFNKSREAIERDLLGSTVEVEATRIGVPDVTGAVPLEFKASATEGAAPQSLDVLLKSLLGGKRQVTVNYTSDIGHTATVIEMAAGEEANFAKGDLILVKEAGAYEVRPVISATAGAITLAFALDNGAPTNNVVIGKCTTYYHDTSASVSISAEHNLGSQAIQQEVSGLRAASGSLENWNVGQLPTMTFALNGLSLERKDEDASFTPDFTADGDPPVTLEACLWLSGVKKSYTELGLSIENELSPISDACDIDGKIGTRLTKQKVTASINPYLDDTDLTTWDNFNDNDDVSLFAYSFNPAVTAGEFDEVVAIWLPQTRVTEHPVADQDGVVTDAMSLQAHRDAGNDSVFLGFI